MKLFSFQRDFLYANQELVKHDCGNPLLQKIGLSPEQGKLRPEGTPVKIFKLYFTQVKHVLLKLTKKEGRSSR